MFLSGLQGLRRNKHSLRPRFRLNNRERCIRRSSYESLYIRLTAVFFIHERPQLSRILSSRACTFAQSIPLCAQFFSKRSFTLEKFAAVFRVSRLTVFHLPVFKVMPQLSARGRPRAYSKPRKIKATKRRLVTLKVGGQDGVERRPDFQSAALPLSYCAVTPHREQLISHKGLFTCQIFIAARGP